MVLVYLRLAGFTSARLTVYTDPSWTTGKNLSAVSLNAVMRTSVIPSSRRSNENRLPSPRALLYLRMSPLLVTRPLMVHLFWYGLRAPMGTIRWLDPDVLYVGPLL